MDETKPVRRVILYANEVLELLSSGDDLALQANFNQSIERYRAEGFSVMLSMSMPSSAAGRTDAASLRELVDRLDASGALYDELHLSDPGIESAELIVDDRILTLGEFASLTPDDAAQLLTREAQLP